MRVLYVSHALTVAVHRDKLQPLAELVDLRAVMPDRWPGAYEVGDGLGMAEPHRVRFAGRNHFHLYRRPAAFLDTERFDLVHVDEEPYSAVTFQLLRACRSRGIPVVFFTWQTIAKRLPPPFQAMRRWVLRNAAGAIAGSETAAAVLRELGFTKPTAVIPQFGVDPARFTPDPGARWRIRTQLGIGDDAFVVGFAGRLVREKGIHVLLNAAARLEGAHVVVVGDGPEYAHAKQKTESRKLQASSRLTLAGRVPSFDMPQWLNAFDVLVLPSLTTRRWKEQFGRVLIEAMASGVPVVGSDAAEIPNVIEDAGLVVPEGDVDALAAALRGLAESPALRAQLAEHGRRRVAERFTNQRVVDETVSFYRTVIGRAESRQLIAESTTVNGQRSTS